MFGSPYSTTIGRLTNLSRIELALQKADIMKELIVINPDMPWLVAVLDSNESDIPPFIHPVTLNDPNRGKKVVVDLRGYGRMLNVQEGRVIVSPFGGAALAVNRAVLQYSWSAETAEIYASMSDLPMAIFSRWLTTQLSRGLAVDELNQQRLSVILAYFYYNLFSVKPLTPLEAKKLATKVSRTLRLNMELVLEFIPETIPTNIDELVGLLSNGQYGVRLESLNKGLFITVCTGGMYGMNGVKDVMAVAIEFPPTFLAIVHTAINDRGYNKTPLTVAAKPFDRNGAFKDFNLAFDGLLGSV